MFLNKQLDNVSICMSGIMISNSGENTVIFTSNDGLLIRQWHRFGAPAGADTLYSAGGTVVSIACKDLRLNVFSRWNNENDTV